MEFEMETELLPSPADRPHSNGRKHIVTIACTAVTCILLIMVYVKLESVNIEEKRTGCQTGFRGSNGHEGQEGAPWAEVHPGEPEMHGPIEPKGNTGSGPARLLSEVETLTEGSQNLRSSKGIIVDGIIAGTSSGLVIVPLDSKEQRTISRFPTLGVAFNWQSRKVYWIEFLNGIKTADLDGSHEELLISDTSDLCGLAVDQITGNFYYGVRKSKARIQVCDSMGEKCATIASGVNIVGKYAWDIALSPSEGYMFWSSPLDKKGVTRANMDGTQATVIISDDIWGLYLEEFTDKLYWTNHFDNSIGHGDFNGTNPKVLLKTSVYPIDIAVDGDTVYFASEIPYNGDVIDRPRPCDVYSVTSSGQVSFIANTTEPVNHIALFGRNKVSSRPNPCNNSTCANLCVLSRFSYTCL